MLTPVRPSFSERASTGPRHRCRGSASATSTSPGPSRLLQRGLGIAAEDRCRPCTRHRQSTPASTGPRHRCRGSSGERCVRAVRREASTGPRHRCRGSVRPSRALFMGDVASTGPRHRCRGSQVPKPKAAPATRASTGPRHRCRGSTFTDNSVKVPDWLQRGLGIAAEDRPREVDEPAALVWLQRGLGIAAEDRYLLSDGNSGLAHASTGPRHRCRGSCARSARASHSSACFNGASASLPRIAV